MSDATVWLLHSGGMSSRQWRLLERTLQATHPVIAPDFLGSGENPRWPDDQPFHFEQDVEQLATKIAAGCHPHHSQQGARHRL